MIRFHDSMAKKVVPLTTREPGRVLMYVCGPTVYNYIHIGNARTFLWFDFIRSYLIYRGYDVTYAMNYTDVDDRIIERAKIEGIPTDGITSKYARAFEEDMAALGSRPPDIIPKATEHIDDMVKAIEGLVEKGIAYVVDGDVFFSVEDFEGYGKLSGRTLDDMRAGERVEPHASKKNPLDFALWKAAKEDEPSWPSPWGPGRPGWHIECSVMSTKYLGMGFDIHAGGSDLTFPHHENEIAQAEALAETAPFVRHWLHSGMVHMEASETDAAGGGADSTLGGATKMSKSLGNVVTAHDVVQQYPREIVRYWALTSSYRSQPVFSPEALADAAQGYERWATFREATSHALGDRAPAAPARPVRPIDADPPTGRGGEFLARFIEALDEDFNAAEAFAALHDMLRDANKSIEGAQKADEQSVAALLEYVEAFDEMTAVLGFSFSEGESSSELLGGLVEFLLELREQARKEQAFERADAIRARLGELGVTVEDTPAGARWRLGAGP